MHALLSALLGFGCQPDAFRQRQGNKHEVGLLRQSVELWSSARRPYDLHLLRLDGLIQRTSPRLYQVAECTQVAFFQFDMGLVMSSR